MVVLAHDIGLALVLIVKTLRLSYADMGHRYLRPVCGLLSSKVTVASCDRARTATFFKRRNTFMTLSMDAAALGIGFSNVSPNEF